MRRLWHHSWTWVWMFEVKLYTVLGIMCSSVAFLCVLRRVRGLRRSQLWPFVSVANSNAYYFSDKPLAIQKRSLLLTVIRCQTDQLMISTIMIPRMALQGWLLVSGNSCSNRESYMFQVAIWSVLSHRQMLFIFKLMAKCLPILSRIWKKNLSQLSCLSTFRHTDPNIPAP